MKPGRSLLFSVRAALFAVLVLLAACSSYEEKRIRELMHEKGFGSRAQGQATYEDYVGGLDQVSFQLPPAALAQFPGMERLAELSLPQLVRVDGTIYVPYVGGVYVLGLTERQVAEQVESALRAQFTRVPPLQARIVLSRKVFYTIGEVLGAKGIALLDPDMTLLDAVLKIQWTNLANLGRVYLIRPDAENPLVMEVNLREMLTTGLVAANFQLRERDIIYIPPTFLGMLARLLQRLLEPVGLAVRTMFGIAQTRQAYDILTGDSQNQGLFFRF
jgi:protein involved in polysaccharide export with SLBB domain